ncbi:tlde1 domain-containing protein [Rhizobium sp. BK251]|uniref:tlde1 domain-containing protein n=1 Tax=Rhizobium sp. BK251 TaxID=2512125 RepID=UPI001043CDAD|nr:uncharacterized protein DUF2778 [Rhizobium sp. BK251]
MTVAIESLGGIGRMGLNLRFGGTRTLLAGAAFMTVALAATTWLLATLATMQTVTVPLAPGAAELHAFPERERTLRQVTPAPERLIHVSKFSRLPLPASIGERMAAKAAPSQGNDKLVAMLRAKAMPAPEPVQVAALPAAPPGSIHPEAAPAKPAASSPVVAMVSPAPVEARPSTAGPQVAATEAAAPAKAGDGGTTASIPAGNKPVTVEVAEAVTKPEAFDDASPFGLVLVEPSEAPVPTTRPAMPARPAATPASRPAAPVLAYAPTVDENDDDEVPRAGRSGVPGLARGVAVYDIEAATVYLPSGERLEAHSGLGKMRDRPSYANQRMRGPTPPHTYDLTMRESLFHGVEAIRLTPIGGEDAIHGRNGLLAHTYMLGRGGDSNGCVSFRDYRRFLAAYKRGEVRRLVVVPRLQATPASRFASLFGRRS